jgi:hypothetical protein
MKFMICIFCGDFNWTAIATVISAATTIIIAIIAYNQLNEIQNTSKADFFHRLKSDFFTDATREIFMLFDYKLMNFMIDEKNNKPYYYFEIDEEKLKQNDSITKYKTNLKKHYSSHEIDDLLLGIFEDLGVYKSKGIIDDVYIEQGFEYYINHIGGNFQIQKYILTIRKNSGDDGYYDKFEKLYMNIKGNRSFKEEYEEAEKNSAN